MRIESAILLLTLTITPALAQEVRIDNRLQPATGIRAGQTLHYEIDVLTDTWLTGTPDFATYEVPGTLVTFEGSQGRPIQRDIDGKRYFGVTYRYRLTPLESGVTTLPSFLLKVPVGQSDEPVAAHVPARSFAVKPLPAAADANVRLLAGDVRLSQRLLPDTASVQAGHPLIREIRVTAQDTLALSIPGPEEVSTSSLAGTRLPAEVSTLNDSLGLSLGGERIERIRYLPETAGTLSLPALELVWWDIDENKVKRALLPGREIPVRVTQMPLGRQLVMTGQRLIDQVDRKFPGGWPGLVLVLVLLLWPFWHYPGVLKAGIKSCGNGLRQRWHDSPIGTRNRAIRALDRKPPDLTATYGLIRARYDSTSIRHAPLSPSDRQELLEGMSHYYSPSPNPTRARHRLIRALRRLALPRRRPRG